MDYESIRYSPEGAHISPLTPPKQTKAGSVMKEYFFPSFEDVRVCPVEAIGSYCSRTKEHRPPQGKHLFLTSTRPHHPATSAMTAHWIKTTLTRVG